MLKLNTLYVSSAWENSYPATFNNEPLFPDVNAFNRMNALGTHLVNGQKLWATNRQGSIHTGGPDMAEGEDGKFLSEIHITDGSSVDRLVIGGTTGEGIYTGDSHVIVDKSSIATANGDGTDSYLVSNPCADFGQGDGGWNHRNTLFGNVTVDVTNSTIGSASAQGGALRILQYTYVVDKDKDTKSSVQVNFTNTDVYKNVFFLGDSPMGKDVKRASYSVNPNYDDGGIGTTETYEINLSNVNVSGNRQWAIRGGGSQDITTGGTVTVNMSGTTFGDNSVFAIEENWRTNDTPWALPKCGTDFIFNLNGKNEIKGSLVAGRLDMGNNDDDQNADLAGVDGYYGNRVLKVTGSNYVKNTLWFKEINLNGESSLMGDSVTLFSGEGRDAEGKATQIDGKINIDLTGYSGASRVLLGLNYTYDDDGKIIGGGISNFNWKKNLTVTGNEAAEGEGERYELLNDYDEDKNTISKIVIKGAIKDLYVNSEFDPYEFELGTSYELTGEALFFGENAFNSMADVEDEETGEVITGALTVLKAKPETVLHVAGSNVMTDVLYNNAITIDANAGLIYNGKDAITVNGDVVVDKDGTFAINAKSLSEFGASDILVLSADSITGTISVVCLYP